MTTVDTPDTATRTLVMAIPDLTADAFFGGGCCVVLAEDVVRRELQSWPGVINVDLDPANGRPSLSTDPMRQICSRLSNRLDSPPRS